MPVAASRKPARRRTPARKDALLRRLSEAKELPYALAHSGDQRAARLLEMLLDPAYSRFSFAKLCERAGVRANDVLELIRRYHWDMAMLSACRQLPQVVQSVADAALGAAEPCPHCQGTAKAGAGPCETCEGEGKVRQGGDIQAQRLMLRMGGLLR